MEKKVTVFYEECASNSILQERRVIKGETQKELDENIDAYLEYINMHGFTTSKRVWYPTSRIAKIYA